MNRLLLIPLVAGLMASCAPSMSTSTTSPMSTTQTMTVPMLMIQNGKFDPNEVTVKVGTEVTWMNMETEPHTAAALDGSFNTGKLAIGEFASFTFKTPGDYRYSCPDHPDLTGMIHVVAP